MSLPPRAVLVTRPTPLQELIARHATRAQAAFFLERRDQDIQPLEALHAEIRAAVQQVAGAVPLEWRRAEVSRDRLDRFLFEPEDIVLVVGPDGLVANVARFLWRQPVIGFNPSPHAIAGVLVQHAPADAGDRMRAAAAGATCEQRVMVEAQTPDGQRLRALNEVFVGHRSHQSARYTIAAGGERELQSSSGIIVSTGTGSTGWALSIATRRGRTDALPGPEEPRLSFFIREPWPSPTTGVAFVGGSLRTQDELLLRSEMNDGGVIFGDGIEADFIDFHYGQQAHIGVSDTRLHLLAA